MWLAYNPKNFVFRLTFKCISDNSYNSIQRERSNFKRNVIQYALSTASSNLNKSTKTKENTKRKDQKNVDYFLFV